MREALRISIGELTLRFICPDRRLRSLIRQNYSGFAARKNIRPSYTVLITSLPPENSSRRRLLISHDKRNIVISRGDFRSFTCFKTGETRLECSPNRYSLDSWLRVFITLQGLKHRAVLLHSAGSRAGGAACIFPGRSGAGKSTLIRILGKNTALSDEVVMLRRAGKNRITACSTPFWGELKKGNGGNFRAKLKYIIFPVKSRGVRAARLAPGQAFRKLMPTLMFFSKKPEFVRKAFNIISSIAVKTPAYTLSFPRNITRRSLLRAIQELA